MQDDNRILASVEGGDDAVGAVEAKRIVQHAQTAGEGAAERRVVLCSALQLVVECKP